MLHWLDAIVIPLLTSLYGAVGYLGVAVAMAIESAGVPIPSELILPFAGFLVADPTAIEPLTNARWDFLLSVVAGTLGNTAGSLVLYWLGAWGGRPFLERYGRYLLIRAHELNHADHFFAKHGSATVFWSRMLPVVRTFISFPAGVARMPLWPFILYSTAGALIWSALLVGIGAALGSRWIEIRDALAPVDTLLVLAVVAGVLLALAWRLGLIDRLRARRK
ncbi:MAG: DedA family protein [Chloroflexi bacterium]|nr:DedA family protein [Chloroflexota bacterium]